jgi:radical SAM protein with 4Fe4S-binding SPASM domain
MIAQRGSSVLVEHLHRRAELQGIPLSGTFELTPMCSMACKMCYVRMTPEEVRQSGKRLRTVAEWLELAKVLKEQGTLLLLLTGGEPFTYPGFRELYRELRAMGFVVSINSNATLIDAETVAWLSEDPPQRINITLYGASDETYMRLCNHPTGYTVVTKAIEMLQDAGIPVKLNCSVTPDNVCDLEKIIAYSDERKLVLQATSYMFPPLRRDETSVGRNARFSPEECAAVEARIRLLQRGADNLREYCENVEAHTIPEEDACFDCEGDGVRCRAGKSSFWITWDGRMLLCAMMNDPSYDVFEIGFPEAWKRIRERVSAIRLPQECAAYDSKDVCRSCAAMIYTETGCYDKKPQYRCDLLRATPGACRALLKEEHHESET